MRNQIECPWCGKYVALTSYGLLRKHLPPNPLRGDWLHCPGSGNLADAKYATPILIKKRGKPYRSPYARSLTHNG